MRTYFSKTSFALLAASLVLLAAFSYSRTVKSDICAATDEGVEKIAPAGGLMLWESLTSQFVSSVHK